MGSHFRSHPPTHWGLILHVSQGPRILYQGQYKDSTKNPPGHSCCLKATLLKKQIHNIYSSDTPSLASPVRSCFRNPQTQCAIACLSKLKYSQASYPSSPQASYPSSPHEVSLSGGRLFIICGKLNETRFLSSNFSAKDKSCWRGGM